MGERKKKLTIKERRFVEEMAKPDVVSAKDAAIAAGYSEDTAKQIAHQNLTKVYLVEAIEQRKKEVVDYHRITPEIIFGSAVRQLFTSIDDVLDENGIFDIKKARKTGAIHNIKKTVYRPGKFGDTIAVEMYAADEARREMADYMGLKQQPMENLQTLEKLVAIARQNAVDNQTSLEEELRWIVEHRNPKAIPDEIVKQIEGKYLQ